MEQRRPSEDDAPHERVRRTSHAVIILVIAGISIIIPFAGSLIGIALAITLMGDDRRSKTIGIATALVLPLVVFAIGWVGAHSF